jgi:hypothetical protein
VSTYLAGLDSSHGRIIVDNGKVVFHFLLLSEGNPIHIRGLNVVVKRLLVLRNPLLVRRSLEGDRVIGRVFHSAVQSIIERLDLALEGIGILVLLVSVTIDTSFLGAGSGGRSQPAHSALVTSLGLSEVQIVNSVFNADGMTYKVGTISTSERKKHRSETDQQGRAW